MAELKIDGRMKVKTLKANFKSNFGSTLRVYKSSAAPCVFTRALPARALSPMTTQHSHPSALKAQRAVNSPWAATRPLANSRKNSPQLGA